MSLRGKILISLPKRGPFFGALLFGIMWVSKKFCSYVSKKSRLRLELDLYRTFVSLRGKLLLSLFKRGPFFWCPFFGIVIRRNDFLQARFCRSVKHFALTIVVMQKIK